MRLTLRTLLACLDHVLPPDEQRELDAKLAASAGAQQLAARIRRVVEQPTIPAPRLDGRGLAADANSVAEYLDNSLEHDRLEAFERICLESDMHLAEVAACHDILATLAHDPAATAPLDASGRGKLLEAMGHHSATASTDSERREAMANARAVRSALEPVSGSRREVVAPRRRSSRAAWAAALSALALLVALGALLGQAVGRHRGRQAEPGAAPDVAGEPGAAPEAVVAAVTEPQPQPAPAAPASPASTSFPSDAAPPAPPPEDAPPAAGTVAAAPEPPPPAAAVGPDAPGAAMPVTVDAPRVPQGDAMAIAAPASPARSNAEGVREAPAPPPVPDGHGSLGFVGGTGLLVHRIVDQGGPAWAVLAAGGALGAREDLLVPFGFDPEVNVRGVTIRLLPGTRAVITSDTAGIPRVEVVFGRAVVRASRPDAQVGVRAGGLAGTITAGLTGPAAIAVDLDRPPGADSSTHVRASVSAVGGSLVWRQEAAGADGSVGGLEGIAPEGVVDARSAIVWESGAPESGRIDRFDAVPVWCVSPPPLDKLQRNACEALAARIGATAALGRALDELAADRRVENRILAASTHALLGEFDAAVDLLCTEAPGRRLEASQWSKLEADVVPLALARGANAAARLRQAFEDHGPDGKAEALFAMARGFSDDELATGAAEALVSALEDADLVVRRYAYKCLLDIAQPSRADQLHYRPDGLPDRRREGAAWWRGQLQKGLIRRHGAA